VTRARDVGVILTLVGSVLLAACGGSGGGSGATATPGPHLVTPVEAMAALKNWDKVSTTAGQQQDATLMNTVETPPLATVDDAGVEATKNLGKPPDKAPTSSDLKVWVPHQSSYPAFFLGTIKYTSARGVNVYLVCFIKVDAKAPWLAKWQSAVLANTELPNVAVGVDGYAELTSPADAKSWVMDQTEVSGALVSYLNSAIANGAPTDPTNLTANVQTRGVADNLAAEVKNGPGNNQIIAFRFTEHPDISVAFKTADGGALTFFALDQTETFTATKGGSFTQDAARSVFGPFLAPGDYSSVTDKYILLQAATIPPKTAGKLTTIMAFTGYNIAASGG